MRRRWVTLLIATVAVTVLVFTLRLVRDREPVYKGRTLSEWLVIELDTMDSYSAIGETVEAAKRQSAATTAIRQIGTNALPSLLKWTAYQEPPWRTNLYFRLPTACQRSFLGRLVWHHTNNSPDRKAYVGFFVLHAQADPAIPALAQIARRSKMLGPRYSALKYLGCIGGNARPAIEPFMHDSDPNVRQQAQSAYDEAAGR